MNSKKVFYIMFGLLVLVFIASIAGTVYGTKSLKKTGDELLALKLEEAVLSKEEQSLAQAKKDVDTYDELESIAKAIVPQEKDQARTVREIVNLANQSNVPLGNISFPASTLGQTQQKGTKGQPAAPAGTTQIVPVPGLNGVYAMPITVETHGEAPVTFSALSTFLKRLEKNRRTSHVTSISIQPDGKNRNLLHVSLVINAYIKP